MVYGQLKDNFLSNEYCLFFVLIGFISLGVISASFQPPLVHGQGMPTEQVQHGLFNCESLGTDVFSQTIREAGLCMFNEYDDQQQACEDWGSGVTDCGEKPKDKKKETIPTCKQGDPRCPDSLEDCWDPGLGPGCYGPLDCTKTFQEGVCKGLTNSGPDTKKSPDSKKPTKGNEEGHHDGVMDALEGGHSAHSVYEAWKGHPPYHWPLTLPFTMPSDSGGPGWDPWDINKVPQEVRGYCTKSINFPFGPKGIFAPSYCSIQE
jgi:hypothetical protein